MKREIRYDYCGPIERGTGRSYEWKEGYSATSADGGVLYPWNTRAECRKDAKRNGGIAVFYRDGRKESVWPRY